MLSGVVPAVKQHRRERREGRSDNFAANPMYAIEGRRAVERPLVCLPYPGVATWKVGSCVAMGNAVSFLVAEDDVLVGRILVRASRGLAMRAENEAVLAADIATLVTRLVSV